MKILNWTQHTATPEQIAAGVVDLDPDVRAAVQSLLTFEEMPGARALHDRADALAAIAASTGATAVMIGGAPYLMAPLERALFRRGIIPLYAFSRRESAEETLPDGSVRKVAVFRHLGFVAARSPDWPGIDPLDDRPLEGLLPTRAAKVLRAAGVARVGDLARLTVQDVLRITGAGQKTLIGIRLIAGHGRRAAED